MDQKVFDLVIPWLFASCNRRFSSSATGGGGLFGATGLAAAPAAPSLAGSATDSVAVLW